MLNKDNVGEPFVIDVETTMKCPVGNNKANPFWPENKVVKLGYRTLSGWQEAVTSDSTTIDFAHTLIGHNIAFDIHHLLKGGAFFKNAPLHKHSIWDTQLAEYLLCAQQERFPSLDFCAKKRGGTIKDSRVSDMFAAGMGADEIPPEILTEYLKNDLKNTATVMLSQWKEAEVSGMLPLLLSQMEARQATIEMEHNGLYINKSLLDKASFALSRAVAALKATLQSRADLVASTLPPGTLDPTAPKQLATLLFGGTVKQEYTEVVGTYKNGKPKTKKMVRDVKINGFCLPVPNGAMGIDGKPLTNDKVLSQLIASHPSVFIGDVVRYRELSKQLSTYYEGLDKLIMPDGYIHPHYNHCVTVTGRLSSSEPNLQNITNGNIKKVFKSRWGDEGVLIEADYKQLEMVMLAVLSKDKQLLEDIRGGVDIHNALYKDMHGREMHPEERKGFKRCSFALVYGAGRNGIAEQGNISIPDAKRFIDTFYTRYEGVKRWHEEIHKKVQASRTHSGKAENGFPIGEAVLPSWSGRRYYFKEYVNKRPWDGVLETKFSSTETKNYLVQGGATGDIVPLVLGRLYRVLKNDARLRDKCLLINTVHDSVVFDCHKSVLAEALHTIQTTMENAPEYIKQTFKMDFPLPLKVGLSYGPNWLEQTEV